MVQCEIEHAGQLFCSQIEIEKVVKEVQRKYFLRAILSKSRVPGFLFPSFLETAYGCYDL